ncbi:hypothetical protein HS088_TW15G00979 [Tripterygium wilfordii]|uniref:Uncharacterized protein n=1 Tax=Tripterygium wilfordii TaxID=458696 RepID=A0A7J7CN08_TRIWF|nr:pinin-like isoform X2 [Tripterygium wilfordii]KAF5735472.1 hypothetical protein HS088_TW15G00979 [Tripterygium wilfordii]
MNPTIFNSIQYSRQITPPLPLLLSMPQEHAMFDPAKNPRSRYDSYGSYGVPNRGLEFGAETDESGESTPPLWRTSPNHPLLRPNQYRNLSPEAKTQAIARGQVELMEMVGRMPESSYELSLKDLVEHPLRQDNFMEEQRVNIDHEISAQRREQELLRRRKNNGRRLPIMNRNGSAENRGFLLKMGFPVSNWGSSKKKTNLILNSMDSKVLPKPAVAAERGGEEWWKKRHVVSAGESESVGLSSNSGSSKSSGSSSSRSSSSRSRSRSGSRHKGGGCWALLCTKRGKMVD